jgi:hypothetical protein
MDTPKLTHGRDYEALIGIAMDMGTYAVTGPPTIKITPPPPMEFVSFLNRVRRP